MTFDAHKHHRRSIRLKGYDYSQVGAYFVTISVRGRQCLFGDVVEGTMQLNDAGRMVWDIWEALPARFADLELDTFMVMPNHLHGILVLSSHGAPTRGAPTEGQIASHVRAPLVGAPCDNRAPTAGQNTSPRGTATLGEVVGAFKSLITVAYIRGVKQHDWQPFSGQLLLRNYHEHIIREEAELDRIREYICNNPMQWHLDGENPQADRAERRGGE